MTKTEFTVEEIRNYLTKSDSFGDAVHFLSAENIIKANQEEEKMSDCCLAPITNGCCEDCGEEVIEEEK